jgi:hypothetical protein
MERAIGLPLFPRMNASPYRFVMTPLTCSSVCSRAIFMYPSRQESIPECEGFEIRFNALEIIQTYPDNQHPIPDEPPQVSLQRPSRNQSAILWALMRRPETRTQIPAEGILTYLNECADPLRLRKHRIDNSARTLRSLLTSIWLPQHFTLLNILHGGWCKNGREEVFHSGYCQGESLPSELAKSWAT